MTQQIFIGNLSSDFEQDEFRRHFSPFGEITEVFIIRDRETRRSRGFGFITFVTEAAAKKAIPAMNGDMIAGRPERVTLARPLVKKSSGGSPKTDKTEEVDQVL